MHDDVVQKQWLIVDFDVTGQKTTEILHISDKNKQIKTEREREREGEEKMWVHSVSTDLI